MVANFPRRTSQPSRHQFLKPDSRLEAFIVRMNMPVKWDIQGEMPGMN